jgi:hypothetical protein
MRFNKTRVRDRNGSYATCFLMEEMGCRREMLLWKKLRWLSLRVMAGAGGFVLMFTSDF